MIDREAPQRRASVTPPHPPHSLYIDDAKINALELPRGMIGLRVGLAFGGDNLAHATSTAGSKVSLNAGGGVILALEGMVTPIWIAETVGLGVTGEIGVKYDSLDADNGSISLLRWPMYLGAHALIRASNRVYLRLGGGVEKHAGVHLELSGQIGTGSADFTSSLGGAGEVGICVRSNSNFVWDFGLRYTAVKYSAGGGTLNANNGSVSTAVGYAF
jgi:hypothetical protein